MKEIIDLLIAIVISSTFLLGGGYTLNAYRSSSMILSSSITSWHR